MKIITVFFVCYFWLCLLPVQAQQPAQAQQKSPCDDSLYVRLKAVPRVSLTQSERKYIDQKEQDCLAFKAGGANPKLPETKSVDVKPTETNPADTKKNDAQKPLAPGTEKMPISDVKIDTTLLRQEAQGEPILSGRNIGIFAVIVAAIVGLAVAVGGTTPSPF
jgi:hypothetical protein